jgi:hypothetical protein
VTSQDKNIVLAQTYEYREPTARQRDEALRQAGQGQGQGGKVSLDMTSRFLGLVVVPGQCITKMEVEEFASQMR